MYWVILIEAALESDGGSGPFFQASLVIMQKRRRGNGGRCIFIGMGSSCTFFFPEPGLARYDHHDLSNWLAVPNLVDGSPTRRSSRVRTCPVWWDCGWGDTRYQSKIQFTSVPTTFLTLTVLGYGNLVRNGFVASVVAERR